MGLNGFHIPVQIFPICSFPTGRQDRFEWRRIVGGGIKTVTVKSGVQQVRL